ncbi:MAG TPA: aminotransferase class I/II-fold pyridoxal phosphate-dependent enzyme [Candidatus Thermoplasmatota archaeon]|nr:aminotransferase class I/II-fold pyridoxal phosphate-dependent enzyme [Candidatus Thermoplasmatota archaeon]
MTGAAETAGPGTRCVHAGVAPDAATGALVPPIVQSTTYAWPSLDQPPRTSYARGGGATVEALERRLADLEGGASALAFSSGLAAIDALLTSLAPGARVVAGTNVYGGTVRLLERIRAGHLEVAWVDSSDTEALRTALRTPTALVLVETPSNPTLAITDVEAAAHAAHAAGALLAVDNTFLSPLWQRPLELGADVVVHSTTKYIDGHNVTLGGALVFPARHGGAGPNERGPLASRLRWIRNGTGTVLAPFEAWLTLQGSKTLHLRTERQWANARAVAQALDESPLVTRVLYPGLPSHPNHAVHHRQSRGDGGVVAVDLGSREAARRFVAALRVFTLAENLGAAESLATHPVSMTHADVAPAVRASLGITDGLVRLSLGIEDADDLVADVLQALRQSHAEDPSSAAVPASASPKPTLSPPCTPSELSTPSTSGPCAEPAPSGPPGPPSRRGLAFEVAA